MTITLIGANTYSLAGKRFVKGKPVEVSEYILGLAKKTGLFDIGELAHVLDLEGRPTVYYPCTVEYDIMKQRPHHILKEFARIGYYAVFVDSDAKEPIRQFGRLYVVSKDVQIKMNPSILYWTFPRHVELAKHFDYLLFDSIDFPDGAFHHWKQGYKESLECADMVLASADLLYAKAKEVNKNTYLVPNAVDYSMFSIAKDRIEPKPKFLDDRPVVGFYGAIASWIDTDLIVKAAKEMPEYQFLIIGPSYGKAIVNPPDNLIMTGLVDYEDLPWYLSWFDVAIIPFLPGEVADACSPLKMWEYMSAGKPFVVTNLPEATMGVKATTGDFCYKIKWAHKNIDRSTLIEHASKNSWEARLRAFTLPYKVPELATSKDVSKEVQVVMACSPNWFEHVEKQIYNMDKYCSTALRVFILTDVSYNFTQYEHTKVTVVHMALAFNKEMPFNYNVESRYTKYTLFRLLIPKYFSEDIHKVIYLDSDTLVNCDLWELYNREVDMVAGVIDTGAENHRKKLGLPIYINAGVMLMNLDNLRDLGNKWLAMVNSREYVFNDQDIINLTCKIEELPAKYNQSVCTPKEHGPGIIHYAGDKPWSGKLKSALWDDVNYKYKIPKILHFCWFGGNKKTKLVEKCIESWREYCGDYLIIEWNESMIDVNSHQYLKKAYESGKYAFVNDYVRFYALKQYGGITVDADYEILKPIDEFRKYSAFTGHETAEIPVTAIIGAESTNGFVDRVLQYYDSAKFEIIPNTKILPKLMCNDVTVFPVETFCNYDHKKLEVIHSDKAYGVHHFAGSWLGRDSK